MRLNWMLGQGQSPTLDDVQSACYNFYQTHKTIPDTIKMSYLDMSSFMRNMPYKLLTLESGKNYSLYVAIPGGLAELIVLEEEGESVATYNPNSGSMMVIESSKIDREFEKHVLNKDSN